MTLDLEITAQSKSARENAPGDNRHRHPQL